VNFAPLLRNRSCLDHVDTFEQRIVPEIHKLPCNMFGSFRFEPSAIGRADGRVEGRRVHYRILPMFGRHLNIRRQVVRTNYILTKKSID